MGAVAGPNIVCVMLDQLSAKWVEAPAVGCIPTPNLDRLRTRGTSFTQAFTSNPVCMPARATLATGLTSHGHGVLQNGYMLDPAIPTFMQQLQAAGWRTGALGKVHLRPHFMGINPDYHPYGFDVTHITEDARGGEWLDWVAREYPAHYAAALATVWPTEVPEFRQYGPEGIDLAARIRAIRQEFQWGTADYPENTWVAHTLPFPEKVSQTAWITGHALDFIRTTPATQPLFAHISYVQPHSPFCPPADYMACVDVNGIPTPAGVEWADDPLCPRCFDPQGHIPEQWRALRQYYFADLVHLDAQLGRVFDALADAGRMEDTYIILLADHGEMLFDHGLKGKGEFHYDACIRVPLVIAGPGVQGGETCDALVKLEDLFPTVLAMAGLPLPQPPIAGPYLHQAPPPVPGASLLGLCRGEIPATWRDAVYVESYNSIFNASPDTWARTIRTRDVRYTVYPGGVGEQLFCLADDPDEQQNRAADPAYAALRRDLRDRLLDLLILQDYPHPPRGLFAHGVH